MTIQIRLEIRSLEGARSIALDEGSVIIGRGETADVRIADLTLSRQHATIHREGGLVWIINHSDNGSRVNDRIVPAKGTILSNGDVIRLGDALTATVRFDGQIAGNSRGAAASSGGLSANQSKPVPKIYLIALASVFAILGAALAWRVFGTSTDDRVHNGDDPQHRGPSPTLEEVTPTPMPSLTVTPTPQPGGAPSQIPYREMNDARKYDFLDRGARQIAEMMGSRGASFDQEPIGYIKQYVDSYANRAGNKSQKIWGEDLNFLFERATQYAPHIIASFRKEGVPIVVGLYIPMIESEYRTCLESPVGALGMFQFMADTAKGYGVNPADRCKADIMAPAAARYIKDRIRDFGTDSKSVALGIAGYNRSPRSVRRDLQTVIDSKENDRSFWTLIARKEHLDRFFQNENVKYVPKFFAAAIVGENPEAFGLRVRRLSTYDQP